MARSDDGDDFAHLVSGDAVEPAATDAAAPGDEAVDLARVQGWGRVFRSNRSLWIVAAVAVLSLVAGLLVGKFVLSPADAAASGEPPEAGLVTVPVEFGTLSNDVTIRGEVGYADAVEVTIDTSGLSGPAVVTGNVPEVGATFGPLSVALAVAGRPVIVLPGQLPSYRSLAVGMSGPDVVQFKEAMRAVGIDAGDPASDVFDAQAANAVTALYAQVGYAAPAAPASTAESVQAAEAGVRGAQQSLAAAGAELTQASAGSDPVAIREADNAIASAQRTLDVRRTQGPREGETVAEFNAAVADLEDALGLARLRRAQLDTAPDTSSQRAAVDAARQQLADAERALAQARQDALPTLPAGEVLYLTDLPRRVDAVNVTRGQVLQGAAMTVSGATITLTGSVAPADATLLKVGDTAVFDLPDGDEHTATISALTAGKTSSDRWTVTLEPAELTTEQKQQLQGSNVRVTIPVEATSGDVLFVPVVALTAGPGGEARVEVVDSDPREGADAKTRLVVVETGLAAGGQVEISPLDGDLDAGDLVVVGG
ncbi:hypothetical protein [Microbacterium sp.]|uniref:hypothetical protein n=1 Tax=Microbacterium sp. TaxID=51671 RepID=UPI0039E6A964